MDGDGAYLFSEPIENIGGIRMDDSQLEILVNSAPLQRIDIGSSNVDDAVPIVS